LYHLQFIGINKKKSPFLKNDLCSKLIFFFSLASNKEKILSNSSPSSTQPRTTTITTKSLTTSTTTITSNISIPKNVGEEFPSLTFPTSLPARSPSLEASAPSYDLDNPNFLTNFHSILDPDNSMPRLPSSVFGDLPAQNVFGQQFSNSGSPSHNEEPLTDEEPDDVSLQISFNGNSIQKLQRNHRQKILTKF